MVEGGPRAPCQALSDTAVLATWGPGAASAMGRLRSECWSGGGGGAAPRLPGIQPWGGAWQDQALGLCDRACRACPHLSSTWRRIPGKG